MIKIKFNKNSLIIRLFLSYLILLALFLLFSLCLASYVLHRETKLFLINSANDVTRLIKDDIELYLLSQAETYLEEVKSILETYPYLLGFVIYDENFSELVSYQRKNYRAPQISKYSTNLLFKDPKIGKIYSKLQKVEIGFNEITGQKRLLGYFRIDISYEYFEKPKQHLFLIETIAYLLFALVAAIISYYFTSKLSKPINVLISSADKIKQGEFSVQIKEKTGVYEFDKLIEAFNAMIVALEESHRKLKESHEHLRIVAEFTADWEYWQAPDGKFLYISPSCERITGYPVESFENDPTLYERIIHPEDLPTWRQHHEEAHERQQPHQEIEFRIITAQGETKWLSHVCNPVYSKDGHFMGIRGSNRDITYRKELEEHFFQAQKMESIARLAGGVAHDLNNLMAAIIGQTELLCYSSGDETVECQRAKKILTIARKASALAEQLLNYARGGTFKPEKTDLNQIIRETVSLQETNLSPDISVELDLSPDLWPIYGDPNQLSQVIMNLTMNAAEAIDGEGRIIIETRNVVLKAVLEGIPPGKYVTLKVRDTGVGMDKETLSKIFEPFFSTKEFGRGLGLAAVFGIIKTHRGHIRVYSEIGKGTLFEIFIPAYREDDENSEKEPPKPDA